jgi:uncharacterized protein YprB with RNaseH-like and TPR domain
LKNIIKVIQYIENLEKIGGKIKMSNGENWSKDEIKILTKFYPAIGTRVKEFLPERSESSLSHKASRLGIHFKDLALGKVGFFDIESSGLNADFGWMFCWCIKTLGEDEYFYGVVTPAEIRAGTLDKRIIAELVEALKQYKRIYTYYGSRFDVPFSRTRALSHGLDFVPYGLVEHRDLWYLARRILKLHRNRLENVCDILGITGKTHLEPKIWIMANTGDEDSLDYILKHNFIDVEILEKCYKKLSEFEARQRRYM